MPTIVETLTQLGQDLRDVIAACRNLRTEITAYFETKKTEILVLISGYRDREVTTLVYCDPVNGSDANDGLTIANPKKSIDTIIRGMKSNATEIRLLNDAKINYRHNLYATLSLVGVQPANNATGEILARRTLTFLSPATNSPDPGLGSFCSGLFIVGTLFRTENIDVDLYNVASDLTYRSHLTAAGSGTISMVGPTITASSYAGALIGTTRGRAVVYINPVLGAGAAGHVFEGVNAGANPNAVWAYSTPITSA